VPSQTFARWYTKCKNSSQLFASFSSMIYRVAWSTEKRCYFVQLTLCEHNSVRSAEMCTIYGAWLNSRFKIIPSINPRQKMKGYCICFLQAHYPCVNLVISVRVFFPACEPFSVTQLIVYENINLHVYSSRICKLAY
jgi:hypothetical protein